MGPLCCQRRAFQWPQHRRTRAGWTAYVGQILESEELPMKGIP